LEKGKAMACENWRDKIDAHVDNELSGPDLRALDQHLASCHDCTAALLGRMQMKRAIHAAGQRFTPTPEFRRRLQGQIAQQQRRPRFATRFTSRFGTSSATWAMALAAAIVLFAVILTANYVTAASARKRLFSEVADLHVASLASSSPVDVVSTDRHTVKPWFQGKIPFSFDLPELRNTEFTLLGGRMAYLNQTPGAQLIYDIRKHHISVFIFPETAFGTASARLSSVPKDVPFNVETWSQRNLRYFVIGDSNPTDLNQLAKLFKTE
jgi:anti-sigma factor RsiW